MRKTVYLPDDLAARIDEYLKVHRSETFSSLVQRMLEREVPSPGRPSILELIGFVSVDPAEVDKDF